MGEWNVDTLKEHLEARLADADKRYENRFLAQEGAVAAALVAQEKAVNAAQSAANVAVSKAEIAAEKRLDAVNEFRGQLRDQAQQLATRTEVDQRFIAQAERMAKIEENQNLVMGQAMGKGSVTGPIWGVIGAVVAALLTAAVLYLVRK